MIDLGLPRITALLKHTPQTWKAVHVAGTNGKGSICAYLTAMFRANQISCGRFTSPHLVDRWDGITINDRPIAQHKFLHFENLVKQRNLDHRIGASEFELLTATAFEIFEAERVEYGVIEVGLGGRLDSTNAMKHKEVTVIAKIGLDHQNFLGDTIEEIALEKAGIMQKGVPCVVDASNTRSVLDAIEKHAQKVATTVQLVDPSTSWLVNKFGNTIEEHQKQNLACAFTAFSLVLPQKAESEEVLVPAIKNTVWPGRLQSLSLERISSRKEPVLLDGAHNPQSAEVLSTYVQNHLRTEGMPVTWVLAASDGKDLTQILGVLLQPQDSVAAVEFSPVDRMPWVKPMKTETILDAAGKHDIEPENQLSAKRDVELALSWASRHANGGPLVIAGSLYLRDTPTRLIVVCCHGIWLGGGGGDGGDGPARGFDEREWLIAGFQTGETPTFIEHIKAGLRALKDDENSVLMFSGGPTRRETRLTEAESYSNLAAANSYFSILSESEASRRISHENRALDSYSNVLFSLIQFWYDQGAWPRRLTIVSHAFKRERLVDCHCGAIGFPLEQVDFIGVDPPGMIDGSNETAVKGVVEAVTQWKEDPHGVGEVLAAKRAKRNPWGVSQKLFRTEEDRERSGVRTKSLGGDGQEHLIDGLPQPWARASIPQES
ncbi:FolC bifunctional protein [Xylariomycetidae sp. FL2044]|nr:FolC bifunctional protein [Xylariomycetidae sp. FL2044]